jgi:hypothetical protein
MAILVIKVFHHTPQCRWCSGVLVIQLFYHPPQYRRHMANALRPSDLRRTQTIEMPTAAKFTYIAKFQHPANTLRPSDLRRTKTIEMPTAAKLTEPSVHGQIEIEFCP